MALAATLAAASANVSTALGMPSRVDLGPSMWWWRAPPGANLQAAQAAYSEGKFEPSREVVFNRGLGHPHWWFRVELEPHPDEWLLEIGPPKPRIVRLYLFDQAGMLRCSLRFGDVAQFFPDHPEWLAAPIPADGACQGAHLSLARGYVIDWPARTTPMTAFIEVASYRYMQMPVTAWRADAFRGTELEWTLFFGIVTGILVIMVVYNAVVFAAIRDRAYAYYVAYVLAQLALFAHAFNAFDYLFPNGWPWWLQRSPNYLLPLTVLLAVAFTREFLGVDRHDPGMSRFARYAQVLLLVAIATIAFPFSSTLTALAVGAGFIVCIAGGVRALRYDESAPIYLAAWGSVIAGGAVTLATNRGVLPASTFTTHLVWVGVLIEVVLLSLGLAARLRRLRNLAADAEATNAALAARVGQYRRQAELLSASNSAVLAYLEQLGDAMIGLDMGGRVVFASTGIRRLVGLLGDAGIEDMLAEVPDELRAILDGSEPSGPMTLRFARAEEPVSCEIAVLELDHRIVVLRLPGLGTSDTNAPEDLEPEIAPLRAAVDRIDTGKLEDPSLARVVDELQARLRCDEAAQDRFRVQLVDLMNDTLELWERTTRLGKIDLAERSRIWSVSQDDGRLRTRTLDRYLRLDRLPQVPRWREVVRTAYFVLAEAPLDDRQAANLEARIDAVLKQAALH